MAEDLLPNLIRALMLEAEAVHEDGGARRVAVTDGEMEEQSEGAWLYRFRTDGSASLQDDTPIQIAIGGRRTSGVTVSVAPGEILVALDADLDAHIPKAMLYADDAFLLERLGERLQETREGAWFNHDAARRAFGFAAPEAGEEEPEASVTVDGRLNPEQTGALRRALGSETTFVWGPPGTGKTTTLARIVEAHWLRNRSVLLVSNTNIAVDAALEEVAERIAEDSGFREGLAVRHGPVVKEDLRERFGAFVGEEQIEARLSASLKAEASRVSGELKTLQAEAAELEGALSALERFARIEAGLAEGEAAIETARRLSRAQAQEAEWQYAQAARYGEQAEEAAARNFLSRLVRRENPRRLLEMGEEAAAQGREARRQAQRAADEAARIERNLAPVREERQALAAEAASLPPAEELEAQSREKVAAIQSRLARLKEISAAIGDIRRSILARARIVATTVYRCYLNEALCKRNFDVVVIDEASMLMPPLSYFAAGLSGQRVTIAGDFRQLAPIVRSEGPLANRWLKRNVFEVAGVSAYIDGRQRPPPLGALRAQARQERSGAVVPNLVALTTQYRMREPICEVVSERFYGGILRTHQSANARTRAFPLGERALIAIDTSAWRPWAAMPKRGRSRYNPLHAALALQLAQSYRAAAQAAGRDPMTAIGIVSPYAAQARLTQSLISARIAEGAGMATTIHRFQGNEREAMVLDLPEAEGVSIGRFLKATDIAEDGGRLLNVALSRAQGQVILIADFAYLRGRLAANAILRPILDHFAQEGTAMTPAEVFAPGNVAERFDADGFAERFRRDLEAARETIAIFSPAPTAQGVGAWADALEDAADRGVAVQIVTPRTRIQRTREALAFTGVEVAPAERMEQRAAVVDRRIVWFGAGDILRHDHPPREMLRIVDAALAARL